MIINDEEKYIFTSVPKTGSTSIMAQLDSSTIPTQPPNIYHAPLPVGYEGYYKFGFKRHPLDRFISTYIDGYNDHGHLNCWSSRLKLYTNFKEFCMSFAEDPISQDIHFIPQVNFFYQDGVCVADDILPYEEFAESCAVISKRLVMFIDPGIRHRQTNRSRNIWDYFDKESIEPIYQFYEEDFNELGYVKIPIT
jgi:chondroitin 4-sulfotransferase 11